MTNARQKKQHTFTIDYYSDIDEIQYQGNFTTKKLSIADLSSLGVRKAQLNGGMHYDQESPGKGVDFMTDDFNSRIAHLEVALVQTPKWWNLNSISDADVIHKVFLEVDRFENSFLDKRRAAAFKRSMGDDEEDSSGDSEESNGSRVVKTVVDKEVQASFEP